VGITVPLVCTPALRTVKSVLCEAKLALTNKRHWTIFATPNLYFQRSSKRVTNPFDFKFETEPPVGFQYSRTIRTEIRAMMRLIVYSMCVLMVLVSGRTIPKPPFWEKAETARWLAHANEYGTLSTTSVHLKGQAWGQTKSFADGSSNNSTGVLYFYDSDMDTSMKDIAKNPYVAFSLSAAQLFGHCDVSTLDPENPRCARVVFSGKFVPVDDPDEKDFAHNALFDRHPEMASWPTDHDWKVHKIDLEEIWLIDIFGGGEYAKRLLCHGFST
jgi:hypothetical protein